MIDKISKSIVNIYNTTSKEFRNDNNVLDFFQNSETLEGFLQEHKKLLLDYIGAFYKNEKEQIIECQKFYEAQSIPYTILFKYINLLKNRLEVDLSKNIKSYAKKAEIRLEINKIYSSLESLVSYVYIKKECNAVRSETKSKFSNFPLFRIHVVWINSIIEAIKNDDMNDFPKIDAKSCNHAKLMQYPHSKMLCMENGLCKQLNDLHELFHKKAKLLYSYYVQQEYVEAYFVFKSLMEYSYKFFSLLKEIYYATYSNLENSFFKLINVFSFKDINQTLTLFDIKDIKQLNSLYGEGQMDEVLDEVQENIEYILGKNPKNSLLIRGTSANFYILHIDVSKEEVRYEIGRINNTIKKKLKKKFPHLYVDFIIASFELDKKIEYPKDEMVRIMLHLKKEAKKENIWKFVYEKEKKEELRKILSDRHINITYIKNKIRNKQVYIVFQPIYMTKEKKIFAVETLARIVDGQKLLTAGMYIDTIYEIGLVTELDILVLDAILAKKDYILKKGLKVFINAAAESLGDTIYLKHLYKFLKNFPKENIIIEITEQQALEGLDIIKTIYQKYDIKFAIDDFGSGYSALKTVSDLAEEELISILKIDGSLIQNLDKKAKTQKIVQVVTRMCEIFGIYSLAEFVENQESLNLLEQYHTTLVQGYHLSKPLRVEELQEIL